MELYFKDLEAGGGAADLLLNDAGHDVAEERDDTADDDDIAFAELAERVSAARLIY